MKQYISKDLKNILRIKIMDIKRNSMVKYLLKFEKKEYKK